MSANYISDKDVVFRIPKELLQPNNKEQTKEWSRHFSKEDT
jgi:hypothetical protein